MAGYRRIVEMELWDTEYVDLVVPGFIEFGGDGMGEFQAGTVHGWPKCGTPSNGTCGTSRPG